MDVHAGHPAGATPIFAFLVGIDTYTYLSPLRGCVNDVIALRDLLMRRLGVPTEHVQVLTNEQATRDAILRTFHDFLINNQAIARDDEILVYFSGYGSRMIDFTGVRPTGYCQTLVPYDGRTPTVFDLPDCTVIALLDQLVAAKGKHITVVLDACHAGPAPSQQSGRLESHTRLLPADERVPPAELDADVRAHAMPRSTGPSGWPTAGAPYVLLAACRDGETAHEYWVTHGGQAGTWRGAFSYFILQALAQLTSSTTYADLHAQAAAHLCSVYPSQSPQCEGNRLRTVLGGRRIRRDVLFGVQTVEDDIVTLNGGLLHGLYPGTELAVYPLAASVEALPPAPLATIAVTDASTVTARAKIPSTPSGLISPGAGCLVTKQVYMRFTQIVALRAGPNEEDRRAIERMRTLIEIGAGKDGPSPYLMVASDGEYTSDLRVEANAGRLSIFDGADVNMQPLLEPELICERDGSDALCILRALENIARYRIILALTNQDPRSQVAGGIKLHLSHYVGGSAQTEELPVQAVGAGGDLAVYVEPRAPDRNRYVVDVFNDGQVAVYPHLFALGPDYSIKRIYPRTTTGTVLAPGQTLHVGLTNPQERLEFYLPDGWDASRDILKVIATVQPSDLAILEQEGLAVPPPRARQWRAGVTGPAPQQLVDALMFGVGEGVSHDVALTEVTDWTTAELPISTVRAFPSVTLGSKRGRIALGDGLILEKPDGFEGKVSVTTWDQARRGCDGDPSLRPPPGLDAFPSLFQPVSRLGTRGVQATGLVISLDLDEGCRRSISVNNPLRLELPMHAQEDVSDLFPIAFDGEDYLLAGYQGNQPNTVELVHLPAPVILTAAHGAPTIRGIRRTVRILIYKKPGRDMLGAGLHRAERREGKVTYGEVRRDQFRSGQCVAIFVHGFASDSRWMVEGPAQFLLREVIRYDHLLTWDYETLRTSVDESGTQLAQALKEQCGFAPGDGITVHVYAHSMGSLVARFLIELAGGHEYIDRVVLAGPPNRGTVLATLSQGMIYLVTALINRYAAIPPLGSISASVREIYQQGAGLGSLAMDSEVTRQLNAPGSPSGLPYLVLAGENLPDETERGALSRLARKVLGASLDDVFGEMNDIAVGLSSLHGIPAATHPQLMVTDLPCDHFHYFDSPQGREAIRSWMR